MHDIDTVLIYEKYKKILEEERQKVIDKTYSVRTRPPPVKTLKAYMLRKALDGRLYPLFVGNEALPIGIWLDAAEGREAARSKTGRRRVKSSLGDLSYRPGWHAGDIPLATHIGLKNEQGKIYARRRNEVWAEVLISADINYQPEAGPNGLDRVPVDGFYRFKTNLSMTGDWIISGSCKIMRILTQDEVDEIVLAAGYEPMPWQDGRLDLQTLGFDTKRNYDEETTR